MESNVLEAEHQEQVARRSLESEELVARQIEFDNRLNALEALQTEWESQKSDIAQRSTAQEMELQRLRTEIETGRTALAEERRQWQLQRDEALHLISTKTEQLAAGQAELEAQRRALESRQAAWDVQMAGMQQTQDDRVAGLDALRVDLDSQRSALEKERHDWETQHSERVAGQQAELDSHQRKLAECQPEEEPGPSEAETAKPTMPTSAAPVDLAAVLRRNGFKIDQADEKQEAEGNVQPSDQSSAGAAGPGPSPDISAPIPRPRKPAGPGKEDDVSIDEYMTRLLARSRGDSAPAPEPAAAAPAAAPRPAHVMQATQTEIPKPGEPAEIAPRAAAPERQVDLKAMRQLANLSATNALHKHDSKRLSGRSRTKLLVTSVSGVVGVSLLVIHQLPGAPPVTIYGALASFAVTALWGVSYITLMSRLAGERMAYMSRRLKAAETPPAEVKEENP